MSAKFTSPLNDLKIASPCSQDWDAMIGVGRKRYCTECKLNVYNLSGMTRREAEALLMNSEGRLCVRFYRRADGTVLTQDCPVGWRAVRRRLSKMATAAASLIFGLLGGIGLNAYMKSSDEIVMGDISPEWTNANVNSPKKETEIGVMPGNYAVMGNFVAPKKTETKENRQRRSGKTADRKKI
jgi:hypothetical protein